MKTLSLFSVLGMALGAQLAFADIIRDVRCESSQNDFWSCYVGSRFDRIEVLEQISTAPCTQDVSYGYDRGSIWVDQGCRAEFRMTKFSAAETPRKVTCESRSFGRTDCIVGEFVGVDLFAELSRTACTKDANWGYEPDTGYLWVNLGCRAVFSIYD